MGIVRLLCSKRSAMPSSECMPSAVLYVDCMAPQMPNHKVWKARQAALAAPHTQPLPAAGGTPSQCAHAAAIPSGLCSQICPCIPINTLKA
jgi:hypothetical protein